ncbi:twin-arginine translocase subunit TatC [Fulvivirgaceae bacterium PWU4]|uniref:Sec-independent protein translocase protein TatC n=1 Tax=Chryseosolibacter histidini TaxID=2782349 RepID=A0AAP2DR96_9BACT|nr:twin-arginine translocase subunit TatC [Chryseosolibacter histidini]MBT1701086.1 twin-arginine translocase subunit TatC [Chryseosolibacter histidini]
MPLDQDPIEEKEMSFLDHLEELRWHVVRSLLAILIFTILAFVYGDWIFNNIIFAPGRVDFPTFRWLCQLGQWLGSEDAFCVKEIPFKVQSRLMTGQFTMHITASVVIGLIVAFPYVAWELWRFVRPGLYTTERRSSKGAVAAVSFLFLTGVLFGYYVMCPMMISFLANYQISDMIVNEFDITSYVGTIVTVVFGSGVLFQLPVVMYFLTKIGIVTPTFLRKSRKHAVIVILIIGAIVTPSADPLSQALISIPLYLLYEISILISSNVVRKKEKEEAEEKLKEQQSAS